MKVIQLTDEECEIIKMALTKQLGQVVNIMPWITVLNKVVEAKEVQI